MIVKTYAIRSREAAAAIGRLEVFKTHGSMYTLPELDYPGVLGGTAHELFYRDYKTADYAIYSYRTPIAWHTAEHGWVYVDRSFSATTNKHQATARHGISLSDDNRVRYVQQRFTLTERQREMLWAIAGLGGIFQAKLSHNQQRTLNALVGYGLVRIIDPLGDAVAVVTQLGKEATE